MMASHSPCIDYTSFPHILSSVLSFASTAALVQLRLTNHEVKKGVDKILFHHITIHYTLNDDQGSNPGPAFAWIHYIDQDGFMLPPDASAPSEDVLSNTRIVTIRCTKLHVNANHAPSTKLAVAVANKRGQPQRATLPKFQTLDLVRWPNPSLDLGQLAYYIPATTWALFISDTVGPLHDFFPYMTTETLEKVKNIVVCFDGSLKLSRSISIPIVGGQVKGRPDMYFIFNPIKGLQTEPVTPTGPLALTDELEMIIVTMFHLHQFTLVGLVERMCDTESTTMGPILPSEMIYGKIRTALLKAITECQRLVPQHLCPGNVKTKVAFQSLVEFEKSMGKDKFRLCTVKDARPVSCEGL